MADPYYDDVVLLLHGNGANDGTVFTDSSSYGRTVDIGANYVYTKTAVKKFGTASINFYAGTGSYLTTAQSTDLDLDAGDMTIEAWVYPTSTTMGAIVGNRGSTIINYNLYIGTIVQVVASTPSSYQIDGTTSVTTNAWHHVAVTKSGNVIRLFFDGNLEGSYTISGTPAAPDTSPYGFQIGRQWTVTAFDGYIDDLRITKGVARYTAGFTPPSEEFSNEGLPPGTGDAALTLPLLVVESSDSVTATFSLILPSLTMSASGGGYTNADLPKITASAVGGASAALTLPHLTAASRSGENVSFTLPALTAAARAGAHVALGLPMLGAYAAGHDSSGERDGHVVLPSLTLSAATGAETHATIPSLSISATVTVPWVATADFNLPRLSASAAGRASETASAAQELPSLEVAGYGGALCSVTIGSITVAASGTVGRVGTVQATLPLFVAVATATTSNTASAAIALPSLSMATGVRAPLTLPSLGLVAVGTATVAVTYEAYALNLKHSSDKAHDELTRYTNFPFDRIVRYKDSYYGMNATGLYLLEGTTDDGDPIPWEVATHITDFGNPKIKTVERAYFGGRLGPDATVTLSVGERADNSYSYTTPRGQTVQNYRQVFGKGAKARYFSVGVSGEDEIELDSLELAVTELARRV